MDLLKLRNPLLYMYGTYRCPMNYRIDKKKKIKMSVVKNVGSINFVLNEKIVL